MASPNRRVASPNRRGSPRRVVSPSRRINVGTGSGIGSQRRQNYNMAGTLSTSDLKTMTQHR